MSYTPNPDYSVFFENAQLADALSSIGIFVSDYSTGRNLSSDVWTRLGYPLHYIGESGDWFDFIHPDDFERVKKSANRIFHGETDRFDEHFRMKDIQGNWIWIISRGTALGKDPAGRPIFYFGSDTDITKVKENEIRLKDQQVKLQTLREMSSILGQSLDLKQTVQRILEQTRRLIPYSTASVQTLDEQGLKIVGVAGIQNIDSVIGLRFAHPVEGSLSTQAILQRKPISCGNVEVDFPAYQQAEGATKVNSWLGIPLIRRNEVIGLLSLDHSDFDRFVDQDLENAGIIADHIAIAFENAILHEQTYQMAMTDGLTGLPNRNSFFIEANLFISSARRRNKRIWAVMLDLDHFKRINDTLGHNVGDLVLRELSTLLKKIIPSDVLVCRYGGEEFLLLIPDWDESKVRDLTTLIVDSITSLDIPGIDYPITLSAGLVGGYGAGAMGLEKLIEKADQAMYQSKHKGRNRVTIKTIGK